MKKSNLIIILSALMLLLTVTACDKDNPHGPYGDRPTPQFDSDDYFVADPNDSEYELVDGTLDNEILLFCKFDPEENLSSNNDVLRTRKCDRTQQFLRLREIVSKLDLDREQIAQLKRYINAYRKCIREAAQDLRDEYNVILRHANQARNQIIADFRNGTIDRDEARRRLNQLNERVRQALSQIDRSDLIEAKCNCLKRFLHAFGDNVLNERQQALWLRWINTLQGPCFTENR